MRPFDAVILAGLVDPATAAGAQATGPAFVAAGWLGSRALRFGAERLLGDGQRHHLGRTHVSCHGRPFGTGLGAVLPTVYALLVPVPHHPGTALVSVPRSLPRWSWPAAVA